MDIVHKTLASPASVSGEIREMWQFLEVKCQANKYFITLLLRLWGTHLNFDWKMKKWCSYSPTNAIIVLHFWLLRLHMGGQLSKTLLMALHSSNICWFSKLSMDELIFTNPHLTPAWNPYSYTSFFLSTRNLWSNIELNHFPNLGWNCA